MLYPPRVGPPNLSTGPSNADALLNRGITHLNQQDTEAAVMGFSRVIELEPDNAVTHRNWGMALARQDRYEEAVEGSTGPLPLTRGTPIPGMREGWPVWNWAGTPRPLRT